MQKMERIENCELPCERARAVQLKGIAGKKPARRVNECFCFLEPKRNATSLLIFLWAVHLNRERLPRPCHLGSIIAPVAVEPMMSLGLCMIALLAFLYGYNLANKARLIMNKETYLYL